MQAAGDGHKVRAYLPKIERFNEILQRLGCSYLCQARAFIQHVSDKKTPGIIKKQIEYK